MTSISVIFLVCMSSVEALRLNKPQDSESSWDKMLGQRTELPKLMIETEVNADYVNSGLFDNWFYYARPFLNSSMHLVFDAQDEKAKRYLRNFNFDGIGYSLASEMLDKNVGFASGPYGSAEFRNVVQRRPRVLKFLLDKGYTTLHVDLDTVWAKNPFKVFNSVGTHDLLITSDGSRRAEGLVDTNLCTCLLYFRPSPATNEYLNRWISEIGASKKDYEDQRPSNRVLQKLAKANLTKFDKYVLPYSDFPPGKDAGKFPNATIYHGNWRVGTGEKVKFFKHLGLWHKK